MSVARQTHDGPGASGGESKTPGPGDGREAAAAQEVNPSTARVPQRDLTSQGTYGVTYQRRTATAIGCYQCGRPIHAMGLYALVEVAMGRLRVHPYTPAHVLAYTMHQNCCTQEAIDELLAAAVLRVLEHSP